MKGIYIYESSALFWVFYALSYLTKHKIFEVGIINLHFTGKAVETQ